MGRRHVMGTVLPVALALSSAVILSAKQISGSVTGLVRTTLQTKMHRLGIAGNAYRR